MRQKPIADNEVNNAKQYQIRSIPLDVSSVDRIARSLLTWSYKGEPLDQPIVAAHHYLTLSGAEVRDAFERYIHPDHFVKIVEGPPVH
jgi:zinc protease